jgi:ubiquinol-cytochrome c reductase cytochrome b subunit
VVGVALHMARVFYLGAYKPPREFQWLSGLILLGCTIGLALSGYLLPWDQQSYWATEVATAMVKYVPVIGHDLLYFLRGCRYTCASTLTLFYAVHVVLLPLILFATIGVHVLLVIVHGQVDVEARLPAGYREQHRMGQVSDFPKGFVPFWPNTVTTITLYMALAGAIIAVIAAFVPAPLNAPANYVNVPPAVSYQYKPVPVWYFLNFYQYLKLFHGYLQDELAIVITPLVIAAVLVLLPFVDRNPSLRPKDRPFALSIAGVFSAAVLFLTYQGWKSEQVPTVHYPVANPSYRTDLLPLFNTECTPCHTNAPYVANFQINSYSGIMKGGILGPAVIPGDPAKSHIILLLEGKDPAAPGVQMPLGGKPLSKAEIETIANWIREGAKNN